MLLAHNISRQCLAGFRFNALRTSVSIVPLILARVPRMLTPLAWPYGGRASARVVVIGADARSTRCDPATLTTPDDASCLLFLAFETSFIVVNTIYRTLEK